MKQGSLNARIIMLLVLGAILLTIGVSAWNSLREIYPTVMAYTKAFAMIKRAEQEFGFALTQRRIGGKGGGGSVLTESARELLMRYEAYRAACTQMAENLYNTHFSTFRQAPPCSGGSQS